MHLKNAEYEDTPTLWTIKVYSLICETCLPFSGSFSQTYATMPT